MKKFIYALFLMLVFMSCDSSVESNDTVIATGYINKIEASRWQYGSHTLNQSQGELLYALKSDSYNLDDFIGIEVEISGVKLKGYPVDGGPSYIGVNDIKRINSNL